MRRVLLLLAALAGIASPVARADWPHFLGPTRDGVVPGGPVQPWDEAGPEILWRVDVGRGFSGPLVQGDRVLLHHRQGKEEILEAMDRATGRSLWRAAQPTAYADDFGFDDGPRGTPAIAGDRVFTFGAEGRLSAVRWRDGFPLWSVPLGAELGADKGFFGFACSPLVFSNRVIVQVGGPRGAGVVAVDAATGRLAWKALSEEAGYASPVLAEVEGGARLVVFNRAGVRVLDPATGSVGARFDWRSRQNASVNAATPLVGPDGIFVTASYDTGAAWLRWTPGAGLERGWSSDEALSSHISTPVRAGGHVIGFHGRQEQGGEIRCVELATGRVRWSSPGTGIGSVLRAADSLVVLLESGELVLAGAGSDAWRLRARAQVLGTGVRAAPALDGDVFLARDRQKLVAVRLKRGS